uniref:Uncharacterized protein n=1 Tax=Tetranychus urticae TaxID=32264 RepID=T1KED3_TETUR
MSPRLSVDPYQKRGPLVFTRSKLCPVFKSLEHEC